MWLVPSPIRAISGPWADGKNGRLAGVGSDAHQSLIKVGCGRLTQRVIHQLREVIPLVRLRFLGTGICS